MTVLSTDFLCFYLEVGLSFARFAAVEIPDGERRPDFSRCLLSEAAFTLGAPFCPPVPHLLIFVVQILRTYYYRIPITYRRYLENVKLVKYPPASSREYSSKTKGYTYMQGMHMLSTLSGWYQRFLFSPFPAFFDGLGG